MPHTEKAEVPITVFESEKMNSDFKRFLIAAALLVLCFARVLYDLAIYAFEADIHSHTVLIPFVSAYLVWQSRNGLPVIRKSNSRLAWTFGGLGLVTLAAYGACRIFGVEISPGDYISFSLLAFCLLFVSIVLFYLGVRFAKAIAFPLAFLFFAIPFPDKLVNVLEIASQFASAEVYSWMMDLSQATYYREGRTFVLPNMPPIVVAQECSGIRSSLVLFITSLVGGHMFLQSNWRRLALAVAVFPLGILRNAFRIFTLSMLSAHWDPRVIDSPLHHRGGPLFFALSLVPFFVLLLWLRKSEKKAAACTTLQTRNP